MRDEVDLKSPPATPPREMIFEFDVTPIGKGRARAGGDGRHYTPRQTRQAEALLAQLTALQMRRQAPFTGPVAVAIFATMPIPASWSRIRRARAVDAPHSSTPDADNIAKYVLDGICGHAGAILNDALIYDLRVVKRYGARPRVKVTVREWRA